MGKKKNIETAAERLARHDSADHAMEQHLVNQMATIDRLVGTMNELPEGVELTHYQLNTAACAMEQALITFDVMRKRGIVTLEQAAWTDPIA